MIATKDVHADVDERKLKAARKFFDFVANKVSSDAPEDDLARAHDVGYLLPTHGMRVNRALRVNATHQSLHSVHLLPTSANRGSRRTD
jgi:hypothetical protein